jgi:hypothetical protein
MHWVPGTVYARIKRPGREADHFPLTTEVTNGGAIPPLPRTSSWRRAELIKLRYNLKNTWKSTNYEVLLYSFLRFPVAKYLLGRTVNKLLCTCK